MLYGVLAVVVLLIGSGCAVGPDYERPVVKTPDSFSHDHQSDFSSLANLGWWEVFQDEYLQSLIRKALVENNDLKKAIARVREVKAQLGVVRSDQFPTIEGGAGFERNQTSGAPARKFGVDEGDQEGPTTSQWKAAGSLAFEIDLWGKLRRATEAAQADVLAEEWARRSILLTLVGDIAQAYFELLELDSELAIAQLTLRTREKSLEIIRLRTFMAQSSTLDTRRAEQEVVRARAQIPTLERQIVQKENQISLLIGRNPGPIIRGKALVEQPLPPEVPAGLPSALLERRPDIVEAENRLVAANAQIGVAKAAFFPQIDLTGEWGAQSLAFADLFSGFARIWTLGPVIKVPLFNAGRLRSDLEVREAQQEQALITYTQTIQQAFREVEDALIAHQKNREVRVALTKLLDVSREAWELATLAYLNGKIPYLDVLVAQREVFNAEIALAQIIRDQRLAVVQLYKALGGGWEPESTSVEIAKHVEHP
ncbi:MAG: membrane protein [Nitrospirales bacterium]|nr:MAG: membrane protein [Nitrospirales bacterium]